MNCLKKIAFLGIVLLCRVVVAAQGVVATSDSTILLIGEQTDIHFAVMQQPGSIVVPPVFSDTIMTGLEILGQRTDTISQANGNLQVTYSYTVTAFDSALLFIPPYKFIIDGDSVWSNSLALKIVTVPVDTTKSMYDIRPVAIPPFDYYTLLIVICIVVGILLLGFVGWLLYKRYLKKHASKEEKPQLDVPVRPADEVALEALQQMRCERIWQRGQGKEFQTQLTDVLRTYIERRFGIATMECTSTEILENLIVLQHEQPQEYAKLHRILQMADLVKFAKLVPLPEVHEHALTQSEAFVRATAQQPTTNQSNDTVPMQSGSANSQKTDAV